MYTSLDVPEVPSVLEGHCGRGSLQQHVQAVRHSPHSAAMARQATPAELSRPSPVWHLRRPSWQRWLSSSPDHFWLFPLTTACCLWTGLHFWREYLGTSNLVWYSSLQWHTDVWDMHTTTGFMVCKDDRIKGLLYKLFLLSDAFFVNLYL